MRWKNDYCTEWHKKFALFPIDVNGTTIWLDTYWMRYVPGRKPDDDWDVQGTFEFSPEPPSISGELDDPVARAAAALSALFGAETRRREAFGEPPRAAQAADPSLPEGPPDTVEFMPAWATGVATELAPGAQLCTRDGRRIGNAVIVGPKVLDSGYEFWPVLTDAGTLLRYTTGEVAEAFWPPQFLMDPATAPGVRNLEAKSTPAADPSPPLEPPADRPSS